MYRNRYGDNVCTEIEELEGAVVKDNCGGLRLADGKEAIWGFGIYPEHGGKREFFFHDVNGDNWESITLPVRY